MDDKRDVLARLNALASQAERSDEDSIERQLDACHAKIAQLEIAVEHRTVIGQAIGILMERYKIDSAAAFDVLSRVSSETNRKIYEIARQLSVSGHAAGL